MATRCSRPERRRHARSRVEHQRPGDCDKDIGRPSSAEARGSVPHSEPTNSPDSLLRTRCPPPVQLRGPSWLDGPTQQSPCRRTHPPAPGLRRPRTSTPADLAASPSAAPSPPAPAAPRCPRARPRRAPAACARRTAHSSSSAPNTLRRSHAQGWRLARLGDGAPPCPGSSSCSCSSVAGATPGTTSAQWQISASPSGAAGRASSSR